MNNPSPDSNLVQMLLVRLERISVDSVWAHRASGVRGALIRMQEQLESGRPVSRSDRKRMIELGFFILEKASIEKIR